jgi:hypothetical protein
MAFAEGTKLSVQRAAHFHCCLCRSLGVEIHHIVPQAEGGSDDPGNAAPLCPSCHETYGANPTKRKFIREARDLWFEICASRYSGDKSWIEEIRVRLDSVATKEDLKELIIRNTGSAGGGGEPTRPLPWDSLKYSFERDEFIHPLIVRELLGWISDPNSTIVAVDIGLANRSNRFYGEYSVHKLEDGTQLVQWRGDDQVLENLRQKVEWFSYKLLAVSPSGIHVVDCRDCGGGSGVFGTVGLFTFERDNCLRLSTDGTLSVENRILLKILGAVHLGDRYGGTIVYQNGTLVIGPDVGLLNRGDEAIQVIPIG